MKSFSSTALKVALPPLLGVLGTLLAMTFPEFHAPFCAGIVGGV
jgi:hypothetical protein